jgi:hypothetical protein
VALWALNVDELRQIRVYRKGNEAVEFAMFSVDGERVVAADASDNVFIWDTVTGEVLRSMGHK